MPPGAATHGNRCQTVAGRTHSWRVTRQRRRHFRRGVLALLTVVEVTPLPLRPPPPPPPPSNDGADVVADDLQVVPLALRRLHFDRLGQLVQDPLGFAKVAYGWGDESFDGKRLFALINDL